MTANDLSQILGLISLGGTLLQNDFSWSKRTPGCNAAFDFVVAFIDLYHFYCPVAERTPASLPRASELIFCWVASMIVFVADLFKTSSTTLRGRFFPDTMVVKSGTKDETRFPPTSVAIGKTYFFIKGIATRPICIANASMAPEPNCTGGR